MATNSTCPTGVSSASASANSIRPTTRHQLTLPGTSNKPSTPVYGEFLTPTLRATRSPMQSQYPTRKSVQQSAPRNNNSLYPPSMLFSHQRISPSSPRNIQDRLIPNRSQTDLQLAQHLLSPLSRPSCADDDTSAQEDGHQVTRILNFGTFNSRGHAGATKSNFVKPLSAVTTKLKIPTKPDRVMAAPGTFLEYGYQSAAFAPTSNLVVALESGVFNCRINEDCIVTEILNNAREPENPFCHVIWNADGNAVICGRTNGGVQIIDLRQAVHRVEWSLNAEHTLRCIALEQEYLLTCGTFENGVRIYDLRQPGGTNVTPMIAMKSRSSVNSLSWSPNGNILACGTESGLVNLWDVRHPKTEIVVLKYHEKSPVTVVKWCTWKPSILLSGSSFPRPSVCIQNTATGVLIGQVEVASEVTGIQFNPLLKQVATSHHSYFQDVPADSLPKIPGTESVVQLWQLGTNKLTPLLELGQHEEGIISMVVSTDSKQLVTMGGDELLCLWKWADTVPSNSGSNKASGSQNSRSLLDFSNLIR